MGQLGIWDLVNHGSYVCGLSKWVYRSGPFNGEEFCEMAGVNNFISQSKKISRSTLNRTWADVVS
jgi:hypothetical protein